MMLRLIADNDLTLRMPSNSICYFYR